MRTITQLLLFSLPLFLLASCGKDDIGTDGPKPGPTEIITFEIGLSAGADFKSVFEDGDQIGVFAVKHGQTLSATATGNHIHNVKLTYSSAGDGTWTPAESLWFPAENTMLDFYAYYPYDADATDPTDIAFQVKTDQSGTTSANSADKSNYNLSDFLTAKSDNSGSGWGEGSTVLLTFSHALAMVEVTVDDCVGAFHFNDEVTVKLRGVKPGAALDLSAADGTTPGSGVSLATTGNEATDITMHRIPDMDGYVYRALVPAQTLDEGTSIFRIVCGDVLLDGPKLTANLAMVAGRAETFTQQTPVSALPLIPAKDKTFSMGQSDVVTPVREVSFTKDFHMGRYPATNAQYAAFLNANNIGSDCRGSVTYYKDNFSTTVTETQIFVPQGNQWIAYVDGTWKAQAGIENHPINATWYGAAAYCAWLTQTTGITCTLPTEAQWEYACRGGTTTAFYFGNSESEMGDYGWSLENNENDGYPFGPKPVGLKKPNDYGLYDMHGNVSEWCTDWSRRYGSTPETDPRGPETGLYRVLRGGSWRNPAKDSRSASRSNTYPYIASTFYGFRVVFVP